MKKITIAAFAAATMLSTPAFAAETQVTLDVPNVCAVTKQPSVITVTPTMETNTSSPNFGKVTLFTPDNTADNVHVFCNVPGSQLAIDATKLESENVVSQGAASAGFTGIVDFSALLAGGREGDTSTAKWDKSTIATLPSAGNNVSSYEYGVYQGDLDLTLSNFTPRDGQFLISGDYAGTVQITISPDTTLPSEA